ncbi:MAG: superoxide dismutase [Cu-Zn] SodC2 [Acetobacteraceae bacterium]|nr:superoxide dismutase [Cu-Zn] SodC2 [Acetobacteraceae bacterium]
MFTRLLVTAFAAGLTFIPAAFAADPTATINKVTAEGIGEAIGTVTVVKSASGAVFNLNVKGLPPGAHGLHVHENGACGPAPVNGNPAPAIAAGGHWDSDKTGKHAGPAGQGHMGDLPVLDVLPDGTATKSLIAPRITDIEKVRGHALIIHAGGDNYADEPAPLGGGGLRIACGVIQ